MSEKEKLCIICEHFFMCPSEGDYSEYTPGEEFNTGCAIYHWTAYGNELSTEKFRNFIEKAKSCKDFKPV